MTMPAFADADVPASVRAPWHNLFERLLAQLDAKDPSVGARRRHLPSAESAEGREVNFLDPAVYCDPAHFARERERLFLRLPLCLGHIDQLPPGSVLAREICGVPVVLARTRDGELRAFLNVCRHRGARVLPEQDTVCQRQSLACPYHNWTYRLDGSLAGLPKADAFPGLDRAELGLRTLPSAVRHGLIFVVLDPEAGPIDPAAYLGGLNEDLEAIGMGRHRFYRQHATTRACNWKLIVDAFLEIYHVTRLHAGTIGPFFEDSVSAAEPVGRHLRYLTARETTNEIRALPAGRWSPQRHATLVHLVFPNSVIVYHPDYISHLGMFPRAADETLFVHTMLTPETPSDEKAEAHWRRSFELLDGAVFNGEDIAVCEQIQRGLACGAHDRLLIGRYEQNLRRFHGSLEAALQ